MGRYQGQARRHHPTHHSAHGPGRQSCPLQLLSCRRYQCAGGELRVCCQPPRAGKPERKISLGSFSHRLQVNSHQGNRFTIVLREVTGSDEAIAKAMAHLRDVGYVNYFGLQRFGTGSVGTHLVGVELVKGNWEVTVLSLLEGCLPSHPRTARR